MNCDRALDGAVIATIARLGVPIGVVKDRRALVRANCAGHQLKSMRPPEGPAGAGSGRERGGSRLPDRAADERGRPI